MKRIIKAGTTSNVLHIFISDNSKTDGSGLTGLAYNSAGLTAYYIRPGQTAATAITLASITTLGTFVSSGFKEIDATNMPGWYEFDPPDAAIATGAVSCSMMLKGATNMAPLPIELQLDSKTAADNDTTLTNGTYGLAQLVRSTTPANTLSVGTSGGVTTSGYTAGMSPAAQILANPSNLLATDSAGEVNINLSQSVPATTGKPTTVGGILYFIRKWILNKVDFVKSSNTEILMEDDGTTTCVSQTHTDTSTDTIRSQG